MIRGFVVLLALVCVISGRRHLILDEDHICEPPYGILIEWEDICTALCQKWHDGVERWLYTREVAVGKACGPRNRGECRKVTQPGDNFVVGRPGECFEKKK